MRRHAISRYECQAIEHKYTSTFINCRNLTSSVSENMYGSYQHETVEIGDELQTTPQTDNDSSCASACCVTLTIVAYTTTKQRDCQAFCH